jgi:hypothetical protein
MSLLALVQAVQDAILTVNGIRNAPDYPPDQVNVFPYVITYIDGGKWNRSNGSRYDVKAKIAVELHIGRTDLPRNVATAMGFVESIPKAVLGYATISNGYVFEDCEFSFGPLGWGDTDTIGFKWIFAFGQIGV